MTYGTLAGVIVWVALVAAPIFLPSPTPPTDQEAISTLFAERGAAYARGDEVALSEMTTPDFQSVGVGSPIADEELGHRMGARLEFVQFVAQGVGSVGAVWIQDEAGEEQGALLYTVVKRGGQWLLANVITVR